MSIDFIKHCGHVMTHYVNTHHTTGFALVGGGMCALAATELTVRTLHNLWQVINNDPAARRENFGNTVSRNIGGMVLFAACATNAIPGLAAGGVIVLIFNAIFNQPSEDALLVTKAIRLIKPGNLLETIGEVFRVTFNIISAILTPIGTVLGKIFSAVIPKTPEAVAAVVVVAAIVFYKCILKR